MRVHLGRIGCPSLVTQDVEGPGGSDIPAQRVRLDTSRIAFSEAHSKITEAAINKAYAAMLRELDAADPKAD